MSYLRGLVLAKIKELGEGASEFFGVGPIELAGWQQDRDIPVSAVEKVFVPETFFKSKIEEARWEGKQVCILLPWYKSTNPVTAFSIMSMLDRTKMAVMLNFGDAFIAHTRNTLAENFLKSTMEWSLSIDDDMVLPCGNAGWFNSLTGMNLPEQFAGLHTVNRLLSHGKSLVGALYFGRWKHGKPVYAEGASQSAEEAYARRGPHDICKPTKWVGTGCMLIHRKVFLDVEGRFPHLARNADGKFGHWFTSSEHDLRQAARDALDILNDGGVSETARLAKVTKLLEESQTRSKYHSSLGMGEDVAFCVRATQAGHQPHVDMGLVCGHMGSHVFGPQKVGFVK